MLSEWAGPLGSSSEGKKRLVRGADELEELEKWWSWRMTMRR
jgi:hypothetical protein